MKLLIAEDENLVLQGIVESVAWDKYGITEIKTARDGVTALRIAEAFKPDILITDIRMPKMNGLELAGRIKAIASSCSIIIISAYTDKEYFKAAIDVNTVSYIEKPIDVAQLESAVEKACASLKRTSEQEKNSEFVSMYSDMVFDLVNSSLANAMTKPISPAEKDHILGQIKMLFPDFTPDSPLVSLCFFSRKGLGSLSQPELDRVKNAASKEAVRQSRVFLICEMENQTVVCHIGLDDKGVIGAAEFASAVLDQVILSQDIAASIGKPADGVYLTAESYQTALAAKRGLFFEQGRVCLYNDFAKVYAPNDKSVEAFKNILSRGTHDEAIDFADRIHSDIAGCRNTPVDEIREFFCKLLGAIDDLVDGALLHPAQNDCLKDEFLSADSISSLVESLKRYIGLFYSGSLRQMSDEKLIFDILKYIANEYSNPGLSIKMVRSAFYLSESYFCVIFKKYVGRTFNKYITDFRIEKAKQLLRNPSYKVADIAAKVGFSDINYFVRVFKRYEGLPPNNYRRRMWANDKADEKN